MVKNQQQNKTPKRERLERATLSARKSLKRQEFPKRKNPFVAPAPAPVEFAGQWVAWNRERTQIIAHGAEMAAVHQAAIDAGYPDAVLQRVRRPELRFIGVA
jgi:hypothetical protein